MEINTNPNSIVPLYAQIVESLKRDIENGVYNATERIPAEAELAKQYNVSRITVRRAVDDLVSQGLVEKKQGKRNLHLPPEIREGYKKSPELFRNVPSYEYEAWGTDA